MPSAHPRPWHPTRACSGLSTWVSGGRDAYSGSVTNASATSRPRTTPGHGHAWPRSTQKELGGSRDRHLAPGMGTMTMPAQRPQPLQPRRPLGGLHYSWIIVGILVVVQVIGSAISQSAGIIVTPLRDPHGDFGWGIGTIGVLLAVYYLVGALFAPVSGW